jgi:enoyl-CoA hydratase/carnithine racemase
MNLYKSLKLESTEHIATLSFTRAQTLNAITPQFMDELGAVCEQLAGDAATRVVMLTGTGRAFCSGLDLNVLGQVSTTTPADELRVLIRHWQDVFNWLESLPQVTVAAINGVALGAGLELILCCDFRVASTRAFFGLPEVKLGIIPDLGGITRLTRTVGPAWAKEIALRTRNLNAMEALRVGLINRVSEPGDLMGTARKWATQFAQLPPPAVRHAKRLINMTFDVSLAEGLRLAEDAQLELLGSEEFRAALQAAREEKPEEA